MTPPTPSPTDRSPEVEDIYARLMPRMQLSFVPNFFKSLSTSPSALEGVWRAVDQILIGGVLPRVLKEAVIYAISASRDCEYCCDAHLAMCTNLGMDAGAFEELEGREREMARFAISCARTPQAMTKTEHERLAACGVSPAEITELIAVAGLAVMLNVIADSALIELDPELSGEGA